MFNIIFWRQGLWGSHIIDIRPSSAYPKRFLQYHIKYFNYNTIYQQYLSSLITAFIHCYKIKNAQNIHCHTFVWHAHAKVNFPCSLGLWIKDDFYWWSSYLVYILFMIVLSGQCTRSQISEIMTVIIMGHHWIV